MITQEETKMPSASKLETVNMTVLQAIRSRRATRAYSSRPVSEEVIRSLIELGIQAPSAMNQQAWSFIVIQNPEMLKQISEQTKIQLSSNPEVAKKHKGEHGHQFLKDSTFDIFYGATTLVVICAQIKVDVEFGPETDCFLAGENLMLAATGMGLATCPIGLAREVLRESAMCKKLGIPEGFTAVLPIIVGYASGNVPVVNRNTPIIQWVR